MKSALAPGRGSALGNGQRLVTKSEIREMKMQLFRYLDPDKNSSVIFVI
jgi:hypothetical protein